MTKYNRPEAQDVLAKMPPVIEGSSIRSITMAFGNQDLPDAKDMARFMESAGPKIFPTVK